MGTISQDEYINKLRLAISTLPNAVERIFIENKAEILDLNSETPFNEKDIDSKGMKLKKKDYLKKKLTNNNSKKKKKNSSNW